MWSFTSVTWTFLDDAFCRYTIRIINNVKRYLLTEKYFSLPAIKIEDFVAIHLVDGHIRATISLGSSPVSIELTKGPRLDDGEWHTFQLQRLLKVT